MLRAKRALAIGIAHVAQAFPVGRLQRQGIGGVGRSVRPALGGPQVLLQQAEGMRKVGPQVSSGVA